MFSKKIKQKIISIMLVSIILCLGCFAQGTENSDVEKDVASIIDDNILSLNESIKYNPAGELVIKHKTNSKRRLSKKAKSLEKITTRVIAETEKLSDFEKIEFVHDYILENCVYSASSKMTTAYQALIEGKAASDGLAESMQLFLELMDFDNVVVKSESNNSKNNHYFNKVLLDGDWYNIDIAVDSSFKKNELIRHSYFLVSDRVSMQRYTWNFEKYPKSEKENNWHQRYKLVARNQKELEEIVKSAFDDKKAGISVWIDDFSAKAYSLAFAKELSTKVRITYVASDNVNSKDQSISTALVFEFNNR